MQRSLNPPFTTRTPQRILRTSLLPAPAISANSRMLSRAIRTDPMESDLSSSMPGVTATVSLLSSRPREGRGGGGDCTNHNEDRSYADIHENIRARLRSYSGCLGVEDAEGDDRGRQDTRDDEEDENPGCNESHSNQTNNEGIKGIHKAGSPSLIWIRHSMIPSAVNDWRTQCPPPLR